MAQPHTHSDRRDHDRISIRSTVRLWLNEMQAGRQVVFEGYAETDNLAVGGIFIRSHYQLPVNCPINLEIHLTDAGDILRARGTITHKQGDVGEQGPGMGVRFTVLDEENRERLLRYFVTERIREFYDRRFTVEFPGLKTELSLQDVALIVNLWEDKEGRLSALRHSAESAMLPTPSRPSPGSRGRRIASAH